MTHRVTPLTAWFCPRAAEFWPLAVVLWRFAVGFGGLAVRFTRFALRLTRLAVVVGRLASGIWRVAVGLFGLALGFSPSTVRLWRPPLGFRAAKLLVSPLPEGVIPARRFGPTEVLPDFPGDGHRCIAGSDLHWVHGRGSEPAVEPLGDVGRSGASRARPTSSGGVFRVGSSVGRAAAF